MLFSFLQGNFDLPTFLRDLLTSLPAFILALTLHEAAHGYVALRCGDPTAKLMGRVTLNPLKHLDPMGFLFMFAVGVGWAKPVPVNPNNFRRPRRDDLLVSLAGITMNLILFLIGSAAMYATVFAALRGETYITQAVDGVRYGFTAREALEYAFGMREFLIAPRLGAAWGVVYEMIVNFAVVNLTLAVFNLLPFPPLDGYHVFNDLILKKTLFASRKIARIGQAAVLILAATGLLSKGLSAVSEAAFAAAARVAALFL